MLQVWAELVACCAYIRGPDLQNLEQATCGQVTLLLQHLTMLLQLVHQSCGGSLVTLQHRLQ